MQENKLGTMPIGRLLVSMSVPMMLSFFIQALYNVVDSIFVARISEAALTAVSLAYPMQNIITALGIGTGVGMTAMVSRYLGMQDTRSAEKIANVTMFLAAAYSLIFIVLGVVAVRPYYTMQTTDAEIVKDGVMYLSIICMVPMGAYYGMVLEKLLTATGNSMAAMAAQATGAVFNIVFDPLLIFGLGPFPAMGVAGAATATVLGQVVAALLALVLVLTRQKAVQLRFRVMLPDLRSLKEIYTTAVPSILNVGLSSAMTFCINQILLCFSTTATAVFGIWMKLQNFSYMPVYGMNNGTMPILSYNFGARRFDRVRDTMALALKISAVIMLTLVLLFELLPVQLLNLFSATENMRGIGISALRIICIGLPFGGWSVITSSGCQALGRNSYSLLLNLFRQLFFVVPLAWAFSLTGRLELVWLSVVIAEVLTAAMGGVLRRRVLGNLDKA